jgi:adenosine deaminase
MARSSLAHAFVEGSGLWISPRRLEVVAACAGDHLGSTHPSAACAALLASDTRARLQWRLEAELEAFESLPWLAPTSPR